MRRRDFIAGLGAAAWPPAARAQAYPARPVRIIVAASPGGATDIMARLIGQWLSERLGQTFLVENRPGANNTIGTGSVARAAADGYTLLMASSVDAINASLYQRLSYDFVRDIAPVARIAYSPIVLAVSASFPARSVPEFVEYAKTNPGKITLGSSGLGTPVHVAGELFKMKTGINLGQVQYRDSGQVFADLLGGQVQAMFPNILESIEYIRERRREFIAGLTGAAAWSLTVRAQQLQRLRRIVYLHPLAENDPETQAQVAVLRQALAQLGWTERNAQIEHRFAAGDFPRMQAYADEVVGSAPDVIMASSSPALAALKQATSTIPIVFSLVNDPAGQGFVASLARPGGNITGFSYIDFPLIGKWLELLKEIAPSVKRITLMFNPQTAPYYPMFLREFGRAAATLAAEISTTTVRDEVEIEAAVSASAHSPGGGLIAAADPFLNARRALIIALAERHRLPVIYGFQYVVREGGLISYSPDGLDVVRRSASYVDRILRGERPGELPVQAPIKYELVINLKTAKVLDLTVPPTLLALANEVIE